MDTGDLVPSLPLITAHISCASTHLNTQVRLVACRLLSLLVDLAPGLLRGRLELVKCYVDMLSSSKMAGKLMNRAHKSQIAAGLCSMMQLFFAKSNLVDKSIQIHLILYYTVFCLWLRNLMYFQLFLEKFSYNVLFS